MIAGFLRATSHNLKYVGIDALARVTRINPKCVALWPCYDAALTLLWLSSYIETKSNQQGSTLLLRMRWLQLDLLTQLSTALFLLDECPYETFAQLMPCIVVSPETTC